ncbi:MAG: hypothetical protein U0802_24885 [Candidatus Binatia bacterium]
MSTWYMGVDDTDVLGRKPGTGRLARELGATLQADGLARLRGVVRQQLLVDPRIPYTSHNSPACLVLELDAAGAARAFDAAAQYVARRSADGSDPGLCLAEAASLNGAVRAFGVRASVAVVTKAEAIDLAARERLRLVELGGTGDGIIGALAGVGLTAGGNAGRFLEYGEGLRELGESITAGALRGRGLGVLNLARNAEWVPDDAAVFVGDRLRPRLLGGQAVLLVDHGPEGGVAFDRRPPKIDGDEHGHGHGQDEA